MSYLPARRLDPARGARFEAVDGEGLSSVGGVSLGAGPGRIDDSSVSISRER